MEIKAVKFREDGFHTQPFAFGGEEGPDAFDPDVRYRGSLRNYLIDTEDEVILVDTGLPAGTPEEAPDETSRLFTGKDICSYMEALAALGYENLEAKRGMDLDNPPATVLANVDFSEVKKTGAIVSPVRCKWKPAEK